VGLFGACQEITERSLAQRQRLEEQERQGRAFEKAPGFIIVMRGPEHTVEFVNNAHRRLFASRDWKGKTIREAFPGLADRRLLRAVRCRICHRRPDIPIIGSRAQHRRK
jgi:PAS domain-containing protein